MNAPNRIDKVSWSFLSICAIRTKMLLITDTDALWLLLKACLRGPIQHDTEKMGEEKPVPGGLAIYSPSVFCVGEA